MSGWQRLGVVLSVLWIVACPVLLVVSQNVSAEHSSQDCMKLADKIYQGDGSSTASDRFEKMINDCGRTYLASTTDYSKMFGDENGKKLLMYAVGVPIVTLWVVGGLLIGTIRWVARGFRRA